MFPGTVARILVSGAITTRCDSESSPIVIGVNKLISVMGINASQIQSVFNEIEGQLSVEWLG